MFRGLLLLRRAGMLTYSTVFASGVVLIATLLGATLALAGGYVGIGFGPCSGPLFSGDVSMGLSAGYVHTTPSPVTFGLGLAGSYAMHNFDDGFGTSAPDAASMTETVLRPEIIFQSRAIAEEGGLYLGVGPSAGKRKINLESFQVGGGAPAIIFQGFDPWSNLVNSNPIIPGEAWSVTDNLVGWHARLGMRFSAFTLELLHERASDSAEEMGGTTLQIGGAW